MKKDQTMVLIPDSTLVYPSLFEMSSYKEGKASYNCTFLIPKSADITPIRDACKFSLFIRWGQGIPMQNIHWPIHNGDSKAIDENGNVDKTNFYYNNWYMRATSQFSVPMVNAYNEEITDEDEIYGGCIVRAYCQFYAWEYMGKRGVSAGLRAVQKIEDGDPIGGNKINPKDIFPTAPKPEFAPPDMDSREFNEKGQQGQSGNRIIGPDQNPWDNEPPSEPPSGLDPDTVPF